MQGLARNDEHNTLTAVSRTGAGKLTRGRRVHLLLDATEAFCRFDRPSLTEIGKYKELFYSLAPQIPDREKREVSICLARHHYTPRTIAIFLALEETSIGAPMLLFSPVLKETDLVSITRKCPVESLRILARRNDLSAPLIRALTERDDSVTARLLQQNGGLMQNEELRALISGSISEMGSGKSRTEEKLVAEGRGASIKQKRKEIMDLAARGGKLGAKTGTGRPRVAGIYTEPTDGLETTLVKTARSHDMARFSLAVSRETGLAPDVVYKLTDEENGKSLSSS